MHLFIIQLRAWDLVRHAVLQRNNNMLQYSAEVDDNSDEDAGRGRGMADAVQVRVCVCVR